MGDSVDREAKATVPSRWPAGCIVELSASAAAKLFPLKVDPRRCLLAWWQQYHDHVDGELGGEDCPGGTWPIPARAVARRLPRRQQGHYLGYKSFFLVARMRGGEVMCKAARRHLRGSS